MLKNNMYSCNYNFPMSLSENDANCIPKLDDSCSFMDFPNSSPHTHLDYEASINHLQFYDLFYQQQSSSTSAELDQSSAAKMADTKENAAVVVLKEARKRCSKKDRHSKINTMHGPRDRRMRLSLDVARKFFNLQDLLGFDKPSKTVDWLLKSSGTAIAEGRRGLDPLMLKSNNVSSNSESCEEVVNLSGSLANLCSSITVENGLELETTLTISEKKKKKKKVKKIKATVARDSRIKARERARERTSQKRRLSEQRTDHQLNLTSSCADQESVLRATHEIVTNSSFSAWEFNPSIVFNYGHNPAGILNLHCLAEFQYGSKPLEGLHSLL